METAPTFESLNLNPPLLKALTEAGYTHPTLIQRRAFPIAMSGRDVCGIAQTGTGKTLAYLLPCLRQWTFHKDRAPQILILVPTRELVVQVLEQAKMLAQHMNLVAMGVYGGVNINTQKIALESGADLLVATPGRFFDLAMAGAFKLKSIKRLVIDEVDEMLNLGFRVQLTNLLDLLPAKRQNLLFSATLTEDVEKLMDIFFTQPIKIEAAPTGTPLENIHQSAYPVPNFNSKLNLLRWLLAQREEMTKVVVFVATKTWADELYAALEAEFPGEGGVIHSNKEQNHRFNTVRQFREGSTRFLIATDIVARGIDISEVSHVINFDIPPIPENYIHRIGRTGRYNQQGIAISLYTEKEMPLLQQIENLMQQAVSILPFPAAVEISNVLIEEEQPKVYMKIIEVKQPKKEVVGPAFHPKSAKNSKVNFIVKKKDRMMKKYGKPITRGQKKGR